MGGNDIALKPSMSTITSMASLMMLNSLDDIRSGPDKAWGLSHFVTLFRDGIRNYVLKLIQKTRPKQVVVCMLYFPDASDKIQSWASQTLDLLGYSKDPKRLQAAIESIYRHAIKAIKIDGVKISYFPMFRTLDGTETQDYVQLVEPSGLGGAKLARNLIQHLY